MKQQCVHFDGGVCYSDGWVDPYGEGCELNHKDSCPHYKSNKLVKVKYKNWQGEISIRTIIPQNIYYGNTEYHKEDQWLLEVWDVEKDAPRTYAMLDIIEFIKE